MKRGINSLVSITNIAAAKKKALRHGLWFRTLNRLERGIMDLTVRYVDSIKSKKLVKVLTTIMKKLQSAKDSAIDKMVGNVGLPLARKISKIAVNWGNLAASAWADDQNFAIFLSVNFAKT